MGLYPVAHNFGIGPAYLALRSVLVGFAVIKERMWQYLIINFLVFHCTCVRINHTEYATLDALSRIISTAHLLFPCMTSFIILVLDIQSSQKPCFVGREKILF